MDVPIHIANEYEKPPLRRFSTDHVTCRVNMVGKESSLVPAPVRNTTGHKSTAIFVFHFHEPPK